MVDMFDQLAEVFRFINDPIKVRRLAGSESFDLKEKLSWNHTANCSDRVPIRLPEKPSTNGGLRRLDRTQRTLSSVSDADAIFRFQALAVSFYYLYSFGQETPLKECDGECEQRTSRTRPNRLAV